MKLSNQKFTSIKNDFCLIFEREAEIIEVPEDSTIDCRSFNFNTIKDIQDFQENELRCKIIDIIGILHFVGPEQEI